MRVLFIGESWLGSNARGIREALSQQPSVCIEEVDEDHFVPNFRSRLLRGVNRLTNKAQRMELKNQVRAYCSSFRPDVIVVVKGRHFEAEFIESLSADFAPVVNIFPDASPHAHGARLKQTIGVYDLVISRKKYHPPLWKSLYGYDNRCVQSSHGYISSLHYRGAPPAAPEYDLVMIASGREQYESLVRGVSERLRNRKIRFALGGSRWAGRGLENLPGVELIGEKLGASYTEWLRNGKIVIAPVQTVVPVDGVDHPGDEVSARTFQCPAANTFFIHTRTDEVRELFDEKTEVPMYSSPEELAEQIEFYLDHDEIRSRMAAAAHRRAVPAYSLDARAAEIVPLLDEVICSR